MKSACFVVWFGALSLVAANKPDETFGMKNGHFWNTLAPDQFRSVFMIGMLDGWHLRGFTKGAITGKEIIAMSGGGKFTTDDLANMVTSTYADRENVGLPVGWVVMGCLSVERGETTRDAVFMALRKHLSDLMNSKDAHYGNEVDPTDVILRSRLK